MVESLETFPPRSFAAGTLRNHHNSFVRLSVYDSSDNFLHSPFLFANQKFPARRLSCASSITSAITLRGTQKFPFLEYLISFSRKNGFSNSMQRLSFGLFGHASSKLLKMFRKAWPST